MCKLRFTVIGISDSSRPEFGQKALEAIGRSCLFSGGKRHHAIVESLLPPRSEWIDITAPLAPVFDRYKELQGEVVVFASGDPLFFGFASTLRREFPDVPINVIPAFSSLQTLAHRLCLPWQDMVCVSLTGRPMENLARPLIERRELIGVLTDHRHGPREIAAELLRYGLDDYLMYVGMCLGNEKLEKVQIVLPELAGTFEWETPNCVILQSITPRPVLFGIPEEEFEGLEGRPQMITKMPVRLTAIAMLGLGSRKSLWDIGFCTGSVSIEAKLRFPALKVTAFEKRPEGERLMETNCRRFGVPGITAVIGDFLDTDLTAYPRPDAVFIGGYGGRLHDVLARAAEYLEPGGTVVFNSVSLKSREQFIASAAALNLEVRDMHTLQVDNHNPITIIQAVKCTT